eukprot:COSAG04_NODE_609_length_12066_cov_55.131695_11_plen_94_part_00
MGWCVQDTTLNYMEFIDRILPADYPGRQADTMFADDIASMAYQVRASLLSSFSSLFSLVVSLLRAAAAAAHRRLKCVLRPSVSPRPHPAGRLA